MAAVPLMVVGYVVDLVASADRHLPIAVLATSVVFVVVLTAIVVTFMILMRHGYRWARTLLTGGGVSIGGVRGDQSVHRGAADRLPRWPTRSPPSSGRC